MLNGDLARAGGWLSRARRLLHTHEDCVEQGYLLLPIGFGSVLDGNYAGAYAAFLQASTIGERFGDKDLATLGLQGQGRALIWQGEIKRGITLLDEAMVAIKAGEVSAYFTGGIYCSVIGASSEIHRRSIQD